MQPVGEIAGWVHEGVAVEPRCLHEINTPNLCQKKESAENGMSNAVLRRGGEVLAAALVVAFVSLRCMELVDVYCQSRLHLVLHAGLALVAASRPGLTRVTLLSVLYGVMRHRLDVQVYAAPAGTSLAGAIVVIAGASSEILCRKQGLYGRPAPPQPADRSRLTKAPGSII